MKKLENQIIASTHLDRTGDQISKEDLELLFTRIPDEYKLNQEHDLSKPLVAKGYNKKFVKLPDGNYAITMDIEVFNEGIFKNGGGFSPSFSKSRISVNEKKKGDIEIKFNSLTFDKEDIKGLVVLSNSDLQIDGLEQVQKALSPVEILIISFIGVGSAVFNGFFGKAGSDIYDKLKKKLREISKKQKEEKNKKVIFHGEINIEINKKIIELIIPFNSKQLDIVDKYGIDLDHIIEDIKNKSELYKSDRIKVSIMNKPPYWEIANLS